MRVLLPSLPCYLVPLVIMALQGEPSSADDVKEAKRPIAQAWATREGIDFGQFDVRLQCHAFRPERRLVREVRARIWFSGNKMRIEQQKLQPVMGRSATGDPSTKKYVIAADWYCSYDDVITDRGSPLMAEMGLPDQASDDADWLRMFRLYGMVHTLPGSLSEDHLEKFLRGRDVVGGRVVSDRHDDSETETLEVVWEMTGDRSAAFTIVPARGFSILRVVLLSCDPARNSEHVSCVTSSELRQWNSGIWFPSTLNFTLRADEKVMSEEVVTIENADFSHRPEDALFTLASLGIPPGHEVHDRKRQEILDWDGEKLVSGQAPPPSDPEAGARRLWFYTSLATGALGAALVAVLLLRPRAKETS